ncbi:hypothetical protein MRX96_038009 [Rhipicephalus microplus]
MPASTVCGQVHEQRNQRCARFSIAFARRCTVLYRFLVAWKRWASKEKGGTLRFAHPARMGACVSAPSGRSRYPPVADDALEGARDALSFVCCPVRSRACSSPRSPSYSAVAIPQATGDSCRDAVTPHDAVNTVGSNLQWANGLQKKTVCTFSRGTETYICMTFEEDGGYRRLVTSIHFSVCLFQYGIFNGGIVALYERAHLNSFRPDAHVCEHINTWDS